MVQLVKYVNIPYIQVMVFFPPSYHLKVVNITHTEPIGAFHFAHSFVRGNWRREDVASFSLLTKSCHDIDLISYWMGFRCLRVSSFGSLFHFRAEKKPDGATANCLDCPLQKTCAYSATRYLPPISNPFSWVSRP